MAGEESIDSPFRHKTIFKIKITIECSNMFAIAKPSGTGSTLGTSTFNLKMCHQSPSQYR